MKYLVATFFSLFFSFFFVSSVFASTTQTTIYFPSSEKTLETGEQSIYYGLVNTNAVRVINGGSSTVSYVHPDMLSGTVLLTRENGTKISDVKYYPYGGETALLASNITDKYYTGQRKDSSSNLYFYIARYYNPKTGRFISADMAEGMNRYGYVGNNPILRNDPDGKFVNLVAGGVGFAVGWLGGFAVDAIMQQVTTGHVDWGRAALTGLSTGVYGGCVGLTAGVGVVACGVASSVVSVSINTALYIDEGVPPAEAVVSSVAGEAIGLGIGHVGGIAGRALVNSPVGKQGGKSAANFLRRAGDVFVVDAAKQVEKVGSKTIDNIARQVMADWESSGRHVSRLEFATRRIHYYLPYDKINTGDLADDIGQVTMVFALQRRLNRPVTSCRHQASILQGVVKRLGFTDARYAVMEGIDPYGTRFAHANVYVPSRNAVLEATEGLVFEGYESFIAHRGYSNVSLRLLK